MLPTVALFATLPLLISSASAQLAQGLAGQLAGAAASVAAGAASNGDGKVVAMPLWDGYEMKLEIGTPPQKVRMIIDPTVPLITVPNGDSDSCDCTWCDEPGYNLKGSKSSSFQIGKTIGDYTTVVTCSDTFRVGPVTSEKLEFSYTQSDMAVQLFGLSRDKTSWFSKEAAKGTWKESMYSIYSKRERDRMTGKFARGRSGEVVFGGANKKLMKDDFNWIPVIKNEKSDNDWAVALDQATFNGRKWKLSTPSMPAAPMVRVDAGGLPHIYGPTRLIQSIAALMNGTVVDKTDSRDPETSKGSLIVPCDAKMEIAFTLGGQEYIVPTEKLIAKPLGFNSCSTVLVASDYYSTENTWVLTEPFISNFYLGFRSGDQPAVGIAHLVDTAKGATLDGTGSNKKCGSKTANPLKALNAAAEAIPKPKRAAYEVTHGDAKQANHKRSLEL